MLTDEDTFNRGLGRRIRAARKRKGMNQARLAGLLHLGRTSVVMIERGEQRVHAQLLVNLTTALGVSANDLLGLREATPPPPTTTGLPRSEDARAWVMAGLTQPIVITADGDSEEEDRGDDGKDQG
jgi:transcriptional regulator with XRE-family HTH domain